MTKNAFGVVLIGVYMESLNLILIIQGFDDG